MPARSSVKRKRPADDTSQREVSEVAGSASQNDVSMSSAHQARKKVVRWSAEDGHDDGEEDDESNDGRELCSSKICLTGTCQNGRVGCAYYDPVKCVIFVLEDTQENSHFDLTKILLDQVQPDVALTSLNADDGFIDALHEYMEESGGVFQIRPRKDFQPTKGRDRILSLPLLTRLRLDATETYPANEIGETSEPRNAYEFMRKRQDDIGDPISQKWNATIRLSNFASPEYSPLCMASVGALLDQLVRERAIGDLDNEGINELEICDIEAISLKQVMQVNADALFALQVFNNENHASIHSDKTKEGLSLFGTLNRTRTALGRSLLRAWLLRPSLSIPVINARHDAVATFLHPENLVVADAMHSHLNGVKNVPRILTIIRNGKAKISEWRGLLKFTFHAAMLRDSLTELHQSSGVEIIEKLLGVLDIATLREIGNAINEIIDWEESVIAGRVCVRAHIDDELDNRKRIYNGIDSVLSKVAEQICQGVPVEYASSLNVVYFPQLGFLICVPMLDEWAAGEEINGLDGWTFQFSSAEHVYFKSSEMRDLDVHIGDLHPLIVDREIEIVEDLSNRVLEFGEALDKACEVCAELDCLLSFAEASRLHDYRRPSMVEKNIIDIKGGRHPLQEQVLDTFVPNDAQVLGGAGIGAHTGVCDSSVRSSPEGEARTWSSVILCTGANACGKSTYLKQIALIQYMAQIGCFVPAESAILGIVDKGIHNSIRPFFRWITLIIFIPVFTRISTRESVSKVQSAFMIDLNQVSVALRNATANSLILLDEFGKGTQSSDGAGLFCGVVQHLLNRGEECPKVLAATHFHDVFGRDLLDHNSLPISFLHMDILFVSDYDGAIDCSDHLVTSGTHEETSCKTSILPGEKITYLYRVAPGLSLHSHAAKCAEIYGIPQRIADRARYVSNLLSTHELGQLLDEGMSQEETEALKDAEAVFRRFLAWDIKKELDQNAEIQAGTVKEKLAKVLGR